MELNEEEKRQLFQVDGDCQAKVLDELYMTARFTRNPEQRDMVRGLMAKLRVLSDEQCMDLVKDIQKNYHLPYPPRTMGERIALARQQSGAEKLKGHDIMALERFDPQVRHMVVFDVLSFESPVGYILFKLHRPPKNGHPSKKFLKVWPIRRKSGRRKNPPIISL